MAAIMPGMPMLPLAFKSMVAISRVAMAIPETGLLELPTIPTILEDTVAKKKPNTIIMMAPIRFTGIAGISHMAMAMTPTMIITIFIGRSLLRRLFADAFLPYTAMACLNVRRIIGSDLIRERIPPAATAPAPI